MSKASKDLSEGRIVIVESSGCLPILIAWFVFLVIAFGLGLVLGQLGIAGVEYL